MLRARADACVIPTPQNALPGRTRALVPDEPHAVFGSNLCGPFPEHSQRAMFALGCFWGAEKRFWSLHGVMSTAVGYCGGFTPNPTYEELCSGRTAHAEAVLVVFDPELIDYADLLSVFWQAHDPTQGMRQGNDVGTQYRSAIYFINDLQYTQARESLSHYQSKLYKHGGRQITTEVRALTEFYYAETYHQQYLAKNPNGYCGLGGTGVNYD